MNVGELLDTDVCANCMHPRSAHATKFCTGSVTDIRPRGFDMRPCSCSGFRRTAHKDLDGSNLDTSTTDDGCRLPVPAPETLDSSRLVARVEELTRQLAWSQSVHRDVIYALRNQDDLSREDIAGAVERDRNLQPDDIASDGDRVKVLARALRDTKCSCWDHICARCKTLDELFPGWRARKREDVTGRPGITPTSTTDGLGPSPDSSPSGRAALEVQP